MSVQPVVAQYTIRSKQQYIYATNRMREITGASKSISDAFILLLKCAAELFGADKVIAADPNGAAALSRTFSNADAQEGFRSGTLMVVELFCGGGNDLLLFASEAAFREVNCKFSYCLQQKFPGMIPLAVCCPQSDNYKTDYRTLRLAMSDKKSKMMPGRPLDTLPFALMDRNTWQPTAKTGTVNRKPHRFTLESASKEAYCPADPNGQFLDDLTTLRGEESLLAVVHADGNSMGKKIQARLEHESSYDACVNNMRAFTQRTATVFTEYALKAMEDELDELRQKKEYRKSGFDYRRLIADGDDVTFVCNARLARALTEAYLNAVRRYAQEHPDGSGEGYSSCAGVCVFHSHYPFSRAYELAEQACDSAKKEVHRSGNEEAWMDLHFIHSGVGGDLTDLRELHGTESCVGRPWRVDAPALQSLHTLDELFNLLKKNQVTRGNIKTIGNAYEVSREDGLNELYRVYYRAPGLKEPLSALFQAYGVDEKDLEDAILHAIYDLSEVYDLWYAKRTAEKEED